VHVTDDAQILNLVVVNCGGRQRNRSVANPWRSSDKCRSF